MPKGTALERATVVVDIGKTISKASLWDAQGNCIARKTRANQPQVALDVCGIESWLVQTLRSLAPQAEIGSIIPVAHGAAAALVLADGRVVAPLDYEDSVDPQLRAEYDCLRDPFSLTGSPPLPNGLNLGIQLYRRKESIAAGTQILLWPQYWAWRMSGVAASEVTSLGCHTDLWRPNAAEFSHLARSLKWTEHFPPLHRAGDALGPVTAEWSEAAGLPRDTQIHCGIHDSNAALLAARSFPELRGRESTVLSTGTWFVAMRSPESDAHVPGLAADRDCLLNVDAFGAPVPSARFMGGREMEILAGTGPSDYRRMRNALPAVVSRGAMALPGFVPGVGPFPRHVGTWRNKPEDKVAQQVVAGLYAAMVTDAALRLIGAKERILVEGRFAENEVFVRALATLRPHDAVFTAGESADVAFGALCLLNPDLQPQTRLQRVDPLELDLSAYHAAWQQEIA